MLSQLQTPPNIDHSMKCLDEFLKSSPQERKQVAVLPAVSLFSGAGLSDLGYEQAGFSFIVQAELDPHRAHLCQTNFPTSKVVGGDLLKTYPEVIAEFQKAYEGRLQLLSITPPCQGMSSSNPGRGKVSKTENRDKRNSLMLSSLPIIKALKPRIIVIENVSQILSENVIVHQEHRRVIDVFKDEIEGEYVLYTGVIQMADYGLPQTRKRAIVVAIHTEEPVIEILKHWNILPWPRHTHAEFPMIDEYPWITVEQWFKYKKYPILDARSAATAKSDADSLHFVPSYDKEPDRYSWIAGIPPNSGRNAYQNSECAQCLSVGVPEGLTHCPSCNAPMTNRPYVRGKDGSFRLVKGFHSSYRRMSSDKPAPTVMTNSSHLGSDFKIHPWENRVLSIRECSDLQSVPHSYNWSWAVETRHTYLARQVIGEAVPPWFTFLHGKVLLQLLSGRIDANGLEQDMPKREKTVSKRKQKALHNPHTTTTPNIRTTNTTTVRPRPTRAKSPKR